MNNEQFNNSKVNILGVQFNNTTMLEMTKNIKSFLKNENQNLFIVTANPEIVDYATEHPSYMDLINEADYVVADGTGLLKPLNV